ncbi:MAG: alpha-hydroxy-acid oxidizing protein [Alphaproteobacteria bacterium]|nr:alpha-hydroxy-acid oxidizing protein [Alphaproteobacteria bacterium]
MTDLTRYPSVHYLRERARTRLPHFAWEFLDSSTGIEDGKARNESALREIEIVPRMLPGKIEAEFKTTLFGQEYEAPFGVAPVGMSGLVWPKTEIFLARAAAQMKLPYCLSTVGAETPETVGPEVGEYGWYQYYPTKNLEVRDDILRRGKDAGFKVLVITVDVPVTSTRERQLKAGLRMPPKKDLATLWQATRNPAWSLSTLTHKMPHLVTLEKYRTDNSDLRTFLAALLHGRPDWDDVSAVRDLWDGPVILKGIMDVGDAVEAAKRGFDGIVVSNHGARQTDAAPATISVLPEIAAEVGGKMSIIFDSGIRSGLDIVRARALGADFCLLGRPFLYAVAALGEAGGQHVMNVLRDDYCNNMLQLGVKNVDELRNLKIRNRPTPTNW